MTDIANQETIEVSSLEQFKERIAREKKQVLQDNDPILLLFYMFEYFLEDFENLIDRRDKNFDDFLKNSCVVFGKEIEKKFIELKQNHVIDDVVKSAISIENINKALAEGSDVIKKVLEEEITKLNLAIENLKKLKKSIVVLAIPNLIVAIALIVLVTLTFLK